MDYEYPVDYRIVYSGPDQDASVDPSFMYPPPPPPSQCPEPSNYYPNTQECLSYSHSQYIPSYQAVNNNNSIHNQCKFFPRRAQDNVGAQGPGFNKVTGRNILFRSFLKAFLMWVYFRF